MTHTVLLCGAWDEGSGYPRTTALRQALAGLGHRIVVCRMPSLGRGKQALLRQPWRWPWWALREGMRRARFRRQLRQAVRVHQPAFAVVPYPGHHVVGLVRRCVRVPVVLDLFLSAHDTAVDDRGLFAARSLMAKALLALDQRACKAADLVLLDTEAHALHAASVTGLPAQRFDWVPIGDPEAPTTCAPYLPPRDGRLELLFFGTGVPLHGLGVWIDAVAAAPAVHLTLIGGAEADRRRAQAVLGPRLRLLPEFVPRAELQAHIDAAHLVAGILGTSAKADRVVPFKVVHALAAGRPVVTAGSRAVTAVLAEGDGVLFTPAGDAPAAAQLLGRLARDPERLAAVAARARAAYERNFAATAAGVRLTAMLARLARPAAVSP